MQGCLELGRKRSAALRQLGVGQHLAGERARVVAHREAGLAVPDLLLHEHAVTTALSPPMLGVPESGTPLIATVTTPPRSGMFCA